jgi:DNA-binding CsgD family transcriptional regulator
LGGDEAEASTLSAARRGDRCSYQNLGHWLVRAYRARGEPERALVFLEDELAAMVFGCSVGQELVARAELAVLLAEAGATSEAQAHVSRCRDILGPHENGRGLEGKLLLAEALMTSAREGPDVAVGQFEQAIEVFRRYSTAWLETRALEDWALVLLRARCRAQAAAKRREAESVYRRIGAGEPWFDRLAASAGTRGPRSQRAGLPDGLTPREVEVLSKVACGETSREIGEELVLSIRTVERHVANIYLKTGTHGRAQVTAYALAHGFGGPD